MYQSLLAKKPQTKYNFHFKPKFCCKEINYLHWAEPHLWGADVGIDHNEDKTVDDTRGILDFVREEPLSAMDQMIVSSSFIDLKNIYGLFSPKM